MRSPRLGRGATRERVLALLLERDRTVAELARALDRTPNGVRMHLDRLMADELVELRGKAPGVSKRFRLYGLSPVGQRGFTHAAEALLRALLADLARRTSPARLASSLGALGRRMGRAAARRPRGRADAGARGDAAVGALRELGARPVLERPSEASTIPVHPWCTIHVHHCPLANLVSERPEVCAFAVGLVAGVTGTRVRGACVTGDRPSCRFSIAAG